MTSKKPIILTAVVLGLILLCCNMFVQSRIDSSIRENKLVDEDFVEGAPPLVAFTTVALGGFRGIVADMLWLRAISMQEEGKYFEMVQLASWIMKLQPKSTATAAYLGWNMAYNISVTYSEPEDRWRWVNKGIELYHEAIQYNANDPVLYKELGWIYQHKLGNIMDDAQRYYKWQIALEMYRILGAHYPDWQKLAEAPVKEKEVFLLFDGKLEELLQSTGIQNLTRLQALFQEAGGIFPEKLAEKINDPEKTEKLTAYLRVKWLHDRFMLDPKIILNVEKEYGQLDWFLPETFAIYWAKMGNDHSPERMNTDCDRMITHSLQVLYTSGRMLYPGKVPSFTFLLIPNLSVVEKACEYYQLSYKRHDILSFRHGYENFLSRAILTMYCYGQVAKAKKYFKILKKEYPGNKANRMPFEQFILVNWQEEMKDAGYKLAQDLIGSLITRACILLAYEDQAAAQTHLQLAEIAYNKYSVDREERTALPPFAKMKGEIARAVYAALPQEARDRMKAAAMFDLQESAKPEEAQKAGTHR